MLEPVIYRRGTYADNALSRRLDEGSIIVSTTQTGAPAKIQRLQGFKQALEETGGKVKIAVIVEDNDRAEKAVTSIGQALQAHPDAKAVFTISAGAGLGTAQAVRQAGKTDMPVYAFGNDDAAYRLTKEQNLTMVAQDGYKMGYMCGLLIHIAAKRLMAPRYNFKSSRMNYLFHRLWIPGSTSLTKKTQTHSSVAPGAAER